METSAPWNGTSPGDASLASYDAPNEWASYWRSLSGAAGIATNLGGVFRGELNQLEVTAPGAVSPAVVDTGRALAYGTWYENSAAVNVAIPTPAVSTRIDRIVLRKDWSAQTVRITRIAGVEGGGAPSLVQVDGTTWDTPLAQASITTGAGVTITDERQFVGLGGGGVLSAFLGDGSDGDVTIAADTNLARDMYYNSLTVNTTKTLSTKGFRIFSREPIVVEGVIDNSAAAAASGSSPATAAGTLGGGFSGGISGNPGAVGSNSTPNGIGGAGGAGGTGIGAVGGAGGTVTAPTAVLGGAQVVKMVLNALTMRNLAGTQLLGGAGGGGGGAVAGGAEGYGGPGAGVIMIVAPAISGSGSIAAHGGAGNAGAASNGGGGGGGGGYIMLITAIATAITTNVAGGAKGAPGAGGTDDAVAGSAGTAVNLVVA